MAFRIGILISLILLGAVMLYLRKKEKWKWEKILILFTATIIGISILGGVGIFVYIKISEEPEIQTSFWDINLSNSKSTIEFIKGPPGKKTDDGFWIYISNIYGTPEIYFMRFIGDRLWIVGYLGEGKAAGPGIQGIKQGSDLDDVIQFFGHSSQVFESKSTPRKLYLYDKYNVYFVVEDRKVKIYGVYNPEYGSLKLETLNLGGKIAN